MAVREKIGKVISNKMNKNVVIKVENRYSHPIYSKTMIKTKTYLAHDESNKYQIGDDVIIINCRPLSKRKKWIVISEKYK